MIVCKHYENGQCLISSKLAGASVEPKESQCGFCSTEATPKQDVNVVTVSLAIHGAPPLRKAELVKQYGYLLQRPGDRRQMTGTELKKLIAWFPLPKKQEAANCRRCRALETKMNKWGVEGCKQKRDYILRKLEISAMRQGLPFSYRLVGLLLDKAIRNAT